MKHITLLLVLMASLASCVSATKERVVALGGKGAYKGDFELVWNAEKSFRDGTVAAATIAAGYFAQAAQASTNAANTAASNAAAKTAQQQIAADAAVKQTAAVEATKQAAIAAEAAAVVP